MSNGAETFVVVNYGAARARAAWAVVRRELSGAGVAFEAHEAREFGDARRAARAALAAGYRTVAVVGGDGTLSEVVNGFFAGTSPEDARGVVSVNATETTGAHAAEAVDANATKAVNAEAAKTVDGVAAEAFGEGAPRLVNPDASLALLPAGTGNDFARAVEGRRASLGHWIARLVAHGRGEGDARAVDVLRGEATGAGGARQFLCLNAVTLGIGAEVAARVAAQGRTARRLSGELRFALAAAGALAGWRERRVRIRVDENDAWECETNLIAVVNSRFAGGGMMFSPEARVDDGLLDVVTACRVPRPMILREMTRIHRGGHVNNPRVRLLRGSAVTIEPATPAHTLPVEADGDVRGTTPLTLRVLPRALRVVI